MTRTTRRFVASASLAAALAVGACGAEPRQHRVGEHEGIYLSVGPLKYQVQISRQLNAHDPTDQAYLKGLPENVTQPDPDETWFAIFLRIENTSEREQVPTRRFEIIDTQDRTHRPIALERGDNPFAYTPRPIPPGEPLPDPDSPAGTSPAGGALLLFKLPLISFENNPLEFKIHGSRPRDEATVALDI